MHCLADGDTLTKGKAPGTYKPNRKQFPSIFLLFRQSLEVFTGIYLSLCTLPPSFYRAYMAPLL